MFDIKSITPNLPQAQMDAITQNIVAKVQEKNNLEINKKYHADFDKIEQEFKKVSVENHKLEEMIKALAMRVIQLEEKIKKG